MGLGLQIYCIDTLTLENKFSVLTYQISQMGGQGLFGVNICWTIIDKVLLDKDTYVIYESQRAEYVS